VITIYRLYNQHNVSYVGSTSRELNRRLSEHKYQNRYFNKSDVLKIEKLFICDDSERFFYENKYIKELSKNYCIKNKCQAAKGPLGYIKSEELINTVITTTKHYKYFFEIKDKKTNEIIYIGNNKYYAAILTNQPEDGLRRKIRNGRPCKNYSYEILKNISNRNEEGAPCQ
jgi:hypothetical protein